MSGGETLQRGDQHAANAAVTVLLSHDQAEQPR